MEEVSHEMLFLALQTFKLGGHACVLRGRRATLISVSIFACRFLVAGAVLCACAFYTFVAGTISCGEGDVLMDRSVRAAQT